MKTINLIYSLFFVGIVVSLGLASAPQATQLIVSTENLRDGSTASLLEDQFDKKFIVKRLGVNIWAAFDLVVFNEGKSGVIIGEDGWLFSSEEIYHPVNHKDNYSNNVNFISWADKKLKNHGIELVILPLPSKSRLYDKYLKNKQSSRIHKDNYHSFINDLENLDIHNINSMEAMSTNAIDDSLFFKTDTHWTPLGAFKIAQIAAANIKSKRLHASATNIQFKTELSEATSISGDLTNFLPLSPWLDSLKPAKEAINKYQTYAINDETSDIFGDYSKPNPSESIALVGTSYSKNSNWNFDGALKQSLSHDVINYAQEGVGPLQPMQNFIANLANTPSPSKLVVWEIPERYMLMPFPDNYEYATEHPIEDSTGSILLSQQSNLEFTL